MSLTFVSDFGDSGRALGWFDTETFQTNINLEGIYVICLRRFYHCIPEPPPEYRSVESFESYLVDEVSRTLVHECLHKVLNLLIGEAASTAFDKVEQEVTL